MIRVRTAYSLRGYKVPRYTMFIQYNTYKITSSPLVTILYSVFYITVEEATDAYKIAWTAAFSLLNISICLLGAWRCFANNYLHWAAAATWILLIAQGIFPHIR